MAIEKETVEVTVLPDGQVQLKEATRYVEDGKVMMERHDIRTIDCGDGTAEEDQLIKDIINGNLHSAARIAQRVAVKKAAEPAEPAA